MAAEPHYALDRFDRAIAAIEALQNNLGFGRRAIFHDVGEGTIFPDGTESVSGHVIDEAGRVYFFWTDWDAARGRPVFTTWKQVEPEPSWSASKEYRQARASLGLPPTPTDD